MSEMKNCLVCGKEFKPCNTCSKGVDDMYSWRRVVCCPEHFQYHLPIIRYIRGEIDKNTARQELKSAIYKYGNVDFCDNIKDIVAEILKEPNVIATDAVDVNTAETDNVVTETRQTRKKNK